MELYFYAKIQNSQTIIDGNFHFADGGKYSEIPALRNWDGDKFCAGNDRYGFYPVYYFSNETDFAVSNSLTKILELIGSQKIDVEAFAVFLRLGYLTGDDTIFQSIKILPPNAVLTWQNGEMNIVKTERTQSQLLQISRQQAIETYAELFQKAVEKTLPADHNFAVPLSGGRDSRHILLALNKANYLPDACLTIIHPPPRPNEDAEIAKLLCDSMQIPHILIGQSLSRFDAERRKNRLTDYCVFEHGWFLTMADFAQNKWRTIYDGIAGDVLSAGLFLTETRLKLFAEEKFEELAEEILGPEGYLPALLDKNLLRKFSRNKAVARLAQEISKHQNAPNPIGSFFFWNRTRPAVALSPFKLFDDSIDVLTPFLDTEVFDFLTSLPAEMFLDHNFHTETIAFAYPEFAHLPYESKTAPPIFDSAGFRQLSRDIFRFSLTERNVKITNRLFFAVRTLRCAVDKNYCRAVAEYFDQAIILMQLERLNNFSK